MMDWKKALSESEGDIIKAQELLRKKGLASAEKKASVATTEGRMVLKISEGRIGSMNSHFVIELFNYEILIISSWKTTF